MFQRVVFLAALAAMITPESAMALSSNGGNMLHQWAGADRCAQQAQKQFPDYTAESNAKRDNAMKQCLANGNLPPRGDLNH